MDVIVDSYVLTLCYILPKNGHFHVSDAAIQVEPCLYNPMILMR